MSDGILFSIIAVLSLVVAGLFGRAGKTRLKTENKVLKTENDLRKDITPIAVNSAVKQNQAQAEYEATKQDIEKAKKSNDMDWMQKIASDLAKKALEMGAREKK